MTRPHEPRLPRSQPERDTLPSAAGAPLPAVAAAPLAGGGLRELAPLVGPLAVIESERTLPVAPVAFTHAKIVPVTAGASRVCTEAGERTLTAGDAMVLGSGVWCRAVPSPRIRAWTISLDQEFLRVHMLWALPDPDRVLPGLHPAEWDGQALFFHPAPPCTGGWSRCCGG